MQLLAVVMYAEVEVEMQAITTPLLFPKIRRTFWWTTPNSMTRLIILKMMIQFCTNHPDPSHLQAKNTQVSTLLCTSIPLTIISWHTLFVLVITKFRKSFRRAISEFSHQPNTEKLYYALLDDDCEGEYQGQRNSRKMPNGLGRFCAFNGMVYEGYWKKGKYHGTGWMMTAHQPKYQMLF